MHYLVVICMAILSAKSASAYISMKNWYAYNSPMRRDWRLHWVALKLVEHCTLTGFDSLRLCSTLFAADFHCTLNQTDHVWVMLALTDRSAKGFCFYTVTIKDKIMWTDWKETPNSPLFLCISGPEISICFCSFLTAKRYDWSSLRGHHPAFCLVDNLLVQEQCGRQSGSLLGRG